MYELFKGKNNLIKSKKGQSIFSNIGALGIGIATVALVLVITFLMIAKVKEQIEDTDNADYNDTDGSLAWNASREMQENTYSIVGWVGLIVIIAIGVLILGLVRQIRQ